MKQRIQWLVLLGALLLPALLWAQSAQPPVASTEAFRFLAFGDAGTGDREQYALAQRMARAHDEQPFDTVLLLGDNIYPDGHPKHLAAKFEQPYAELLRRGVRFHAVFGNHDVRKGRAAQLAYPPFNMEWQAYRSFVKGAGLIEFFALDTTAFDEAQQRWLEESLAASRAVWKIAFFHHAIYSSGRTHGSDLALRARLEPLFVRHRVAVVLSGHDHIYERTQPQQGVQYFVAGAASGKLRRGNLNRKSPFLAVGDDQRCSFLAFTATREQLSFAALDVAGNQFDSGAIALKTSTPQAVAVPNTPLTAAPTKRSNYWFTAREP